MGRLNNIIIIILLIVTIPVYAKTSVITVVEKGDELVYTSDSEYFIDHEKMLPGETYVDILSIENKSQKDYTFYTKVAVKNNDASLLEKINMVIKVDGKKVYEGTALGKEYLDNSVNDKNLLVLGDISGNSVANVEISTTLTDLPEDITIKTEGMMDLEIYASPHNPNEEDIKEVIRVPITGKTTKFLVIIASIIVVGVFLLLLIKNKEKEDKK